MFEHQIDFERRQGVRGFFTRFFTPVTSPSEANVALKDAALGLLAVTVGWLIVALRIGPLALAFPILVALPTVILLFRPLAFAAGCLFLQALLFLTAAVASLLAGTLGNYLAVALAVATLALSIRARRAIRVLRPSHLEAFMDSSHRSAVAPSPDPGRQSEQ